MRLLVLDQNHVLPESGEHDLVKDVQIRTVNSYEAAERILLEDPPDAAVVSVPLHMPPLADRPQDILPLARRLLEQLQADRKERVSSFSRRAENRLLAHSWPGGIRELREVVARALERETNPRSIRSESIEFRAPTDPSLAAPNPSSDDEIRPLEELERTMVMRALEASGHNQTRAAELLGVSRDQLRYRLKKFDLRSRTS